MKTWQRKTFCFIYCNGLLCIAMSQKTLKLHYLTITIPNKTNSDDNQLQKTFLKIFDVFTFQTFCTCRLLKEGGVHWTLSLNFSELGLDLKKKLYGLKPWGGKKFTWRYHPVSKTSLCWKFKFKMLGVQLTSPSKQRVKRVKCALVDSVKLVVKYFWPSRSLCQLSSEKSVKLKNLWSFFKIMAKKTLNPNYMTIHS